jgi:hypothetical protein
MNIAGDASGELEAFEAETTGEAWEYTWARSLGV